MKTIIMAAGKGIRMLPLTKDIPKVLVEINGKPFLQYVIENLKKAGLTDLGIIVGYKKEKIAEFLENNDIKSELIEQKQQLGTGDAVKQAKDFVGDDNFVVLGGDNLWSAEDFKAVAKDDEFNYIGAIETKTPEVYGILMTKGDKLVEIKEKPKEFVGNLANTGLYKFTPEIFEALDKIELSPRGEYELTDAITLLAKKKKVKVLKIKDYWLDLGSKEDIPKVIEAIKKLF